MGNNCACAENTPIMVEGHHDPELSRMLNHKVEMVASSAHMKPNAIIGEHSDDDLDRESPR